MKPITSKPYLWISLCFAATLSLSTAALAAGTGTVTGLETDEVALYSQPDAGAISGKRSAQDIRSVLPLVVLAEKGDFVQVSLAGRPTWLSLYDVTMQRAGNYCQQSQRRDVKSMAASRGISEACR